MARLEVKIGNVVMKNPVTTASGTFGFGKEMAEVFDLSLLGAITVKGTSVEPWLGNPTPRICETPAGMLNAIGLQNDGAEAFLAEKLPFLRRFDSPLIVNIVGHSVEEYVKVAEMLGGAEGVDAFEINVSCPNVSRGFLAFGTSVEGITEIVKAVKGATDKTVITKLSPNVTDIVSLAEAAVKAGSDALSLINTLLGTSIDAKTRKFRLANVTGGLSGPAVKPVALRMVYDVARAVDVPVIGMGGIVTAEDAVEFLLAGATAVAVGTGTFVNPAAAIDIIDGIDKYLDENGFEDVKEIIGIVS
ncbi:MAG: dihydroorotate dehydrogenase [Abditibacteriota bacterium]|nr:dihydroorotate dehydrogenase [Abditibacteriota bacterium]MBP5094143.1 dihydroorotate dehydrogenase [Abditibacteriota bacterium]MBP5738978.1 dihydroorotate dehydrogenase [Abditibacteriota bacterium]